MRYNGNLGPGLLVVLFLCLVSQSCHKKQVMFERVPASKTNISFANNLEERKMFNILYYLYYYNGAGVGVGDINNDGLPDIYFAANSKAHNKLYLNKGNFEFEDITEKAGVAGTADWCTGVTMADVNGDGFLDIYVSAISGSHGLQGSNQLFINKGNGSFIDSAAEYGLNYSGSTTQVAFFDYDHDGDLDCYILNQSQHPHQNIVDTSNRRIYDSSSAARFYRNDLDKGIRHFTEVSAQAGIYQSSLGYGLGLAVADLNNDGWDDLYIGNDFHENDYYYINNGNGTFTESGASHFKHYSRFSMGNDIADYNNDGQPDVVTVDMLPATEKLVKTYGSDENPDIYKMKLEMKGYQNQYSRNCLQRNNGDGISFSETGLQSGISATDWSWAPLFADFDNDGNKDLFVSSGIVKRPVDLDYVRFVSDLQRKKGLDQTDKYDAAAIDAMPDGSSHPFLFKGDGKMNFGDVSDDWGTGDMKGFFNGAAYADLDNDGNLDLIINSLNGPAILLKNKAAAKNYLSVSFKGEGINTKGMGTKAYVFTSSEIQYQQLMTTRGFMSSCDTRLHFGLNNHTTIDSVLIVWPDQRYEVIKRIQSNQALNVDQKNAKPGFQYEQFFPRKKAAFEEITKQAACTWRHQENPFVDFNVQYLIPHQLSDRGPKLAVADVNGDGLDDMYACGAKGQHGCLVIQTKAGKFLPADTAVFNGINRSDEVGAVFFDANGDKHQDLLVVTGGNESRNGSEDLKDKLYLNNGKGGFSLTENALPPILVNKSCVVASDVDKDGDEDLFIGGLADSRKYGYPVPSYLLLNDGKGHFSIADSLMIPLQSIGMITSASFADINKDGWPDLVVAGEWMAVKIFINEKGKFREADIPQSTGLWQSLCLTDVNGDGSIDILAGNWGHNSKLYAGKNGPLKLYVKDFDKNGSLEQVMAYTVNGAEYPFLAKDELERPLPVLKKAYLRYDEVAGKTVQFMFYDLLKDYLELKAETLSSSCFMNDGKGNFSRIDLPDEIQLAPVFSFAPIVNGKKTEFIAGGNFYGVIPYEGRYDALPPTTINFGKEGKFSVESSLPAQMDELRDIKWVRVAGNGYYLVFADNNKGLVFLKPIK